jgi:long-chain acyl-CoA synthetase
VSFLSSLKARTELAFADQSLCLGSLSDRVADSYGDRTLITTPNGTSWAGNQVGASVDLAATMIRTQINPGDRVLIEFPNGPELMLACLAVCRAGGVAVPLNDAATKRERDHVRKDSGATLTLTDPQLLAPTSGTWTRTSHHNPADIAVLLYTSGTTGKPKGAALTHRGLLASSRKLALIPTGLRRDEVVSALPLAHVMGFAGFLSILSAGLPSYVIPKFRPNDVLDAIESRRSSVFVGVPTMYRMMLEADAAKRDLTCVRVWMSGADAMPADVAKQFQKMGATATLPIVGAPIGQALFVEGYGMVELSGAAILKVTPPYAGTALSKARGASLPGYRTRVVDDNDVVVRIGQVGELLVTGPGVLAGYFDDTAATDEAVTADGWVRTGDLVRRGRFGTVEFVGRAKDVIKVGGYSVYALEVQEALEALPGVAEAAVTGLPDPRKGERVVAAVRVDAGATVDPNVLREQLSETLTAYKVPSTIVIVDELPRTPTGKIRRDELRAMLAS